MTTTTKRYTVYSVYCVDAPHLRVPGMWQPARGFRYTERDVCSYRGAVDLYESMIRGEHDHLSEYVAAVVVYAEAPRRTVRRRVDRDHARGFRFRRMLDRLDHIEHCVLRGYVGDPAPVTGEIVR